MRFTILTLFPEFFHSALACAQLGKAVEAGVVRVDLVNPRDFAVGRHRPVDDRPYGGGPGMVMMPGPLAAALRSVAEPGRKIVLTPSGAPLTQDLARELALEPALTVLCGRYEGMDERLLEDEGLTPLSVGDFVLNGGEAAALCLLEAVGRLVPGFMGKGESGDEESFSGGLLEYPHYTRPEVYQGLEVPEVLRGGSHAKVALWRRQASLRRTLARRPELLEGAHLSGADIDYLRGQERPASLGRGLTVCLLHHPVLDKSGKPATVSLTNLDVHDMCRVSRTYELAGVCFVTPLADQRELGMRLLRHWTDGAGGRANPDRANALRLGRMAESLDEAIAQVTEQAGQAPRVVATSARTSYCPARGRKPRAIDFIPAGVVRRWLKQGPVLLVLGTGHGLAPEVLTRADAVLSPVRALAAYNHLPVRSALAILVDRLLGETW
ncbi:MAG: tRNA (guanosine(37)-N1)-methyltransferase TrmD [Proteobacteria bacterium]|nr:tRNA (guanosine(37)-N1)-methyltransferase TrmD [Pseudomonadota bacterium]MBU1596570.1 tRNA (guanosine(37)-N1)-methyltransferase TrmD [Pseudomonadota bacterium]